MNEFLVPSLCGRTYLYGRNAAASVSSRIVTALTMHINPEVLAQALAEGVSRFPQFAVGLSVENEEYVFCPVDAPVPVFEASDILPKTFGDPALAGYLFMVSYSHKRPFSLTIFGGIQGFPRRIPSQQPKKTLEGVVRA